LGFRANGSRRRVQAEGLGLTDVVEAARLRLGFGEWGSGGLRPFFGVGVWGSGGSSLGFGVQVGEAFSVLRGQAFLGEKVKTFHAHKPERGGGAPVCRPSGAGGRVRTRMRIRRARVAPVSRSWGFRVWGVGFIQDSHMAHIRQSYTTVWHI